jgi:hypothetical protein
MGELAGEIWRKYGVSYTAMKSNRAIFCIREMNMKKRDCEDPGDEPRQNHQT